MALQGFLFKRDRALLITNVVVAISLILPIGARGQLREEAPPTTPPTNHEECQNRCAGEYYGGLGFCNAEYFFDYQECCVDSGGEIGPRVIPPDYRPGGHYPQLPRFECFGVDPWEWQECRDAAYQEAKSCKDGLLQSWELCSYDCNINYGPLPGEVAELEE